VLWDGKKWIELMPPSRRRDGVRKGLRISQEVLAEQLGLARTSVANLEMGGQRIGAEVLVKIAGALAVRQGGLDLDDDASVKQLAATFGVSTQALLIRLTSNASEPSLELRG
jgi:transcriptional regulator with XRE-family HTH domain